MAICHISVDALMPQAQFRDAGPGAQPLRFDRIQETVSDLHTHLLALTHTCSRWRSIALGSPGLWTRFLVNARNPDRSDAFITRSQSFPLSLTLDARPHDHDTDGLHSSIEDPLSIVWTRLRRLDVIDEEHKLVGQ